MSRKDFKSKGKKLELTEDVVKGHIDSCIVHWRNRKDTAVNSGAGGNDKDKLIASCYIDAYQSMRNSFLENY